MATAFLPFTRNCKEPQTLEHKLRLTKAFPSSTEEPKMHDPEYHAIMVLTVVLLSVMIIGSIVASFVWKKWQKEKRRAIELERAKAITQHWIKKVGGKY